MPRKNASTKPSTAAGGGMDAARAVAPGLAAMNATNSAMDTPTIVFTTGSGSLTASSAPSADEITVSTHSGSTRGPESRLVWGKRGVAEMVMNNTANMFVATASRDDMPTMIISGTLISELPPVMAPIAPVTTITAVSTAICVNDIGSHFQTPAAWPSLRGSEPAQ